MKLAFARVPPGGRVELAIPPDAALRDLAQRSLESEPRRVLRPPGATRSSRSTAERARLPPATTAFGRSRAATFRRKAGSRSRPPGKASEERRPAAGPSEERVAGGSASSGTSRRLRAGSGTSTFSTSNPACWSLDSSSGREYRRKWCSSRSSSSVQAGHRRDEHDQPPARPQDLLDLRKRRADRLRCARGRSNRSRCRRRSPRRSSTSGGARGNLSEPTRTPGWSRNVLRRVSHARDRGRSRSRARGRRSTSSCFRIRADLQDPRTQMSAENP